MVQLPDIAASYTVLNRLPIFLIRRCLTQSVNVKQSSVDNVVVLSCATLQRRLGSLYLPYASRALCCGAVAVCGRLA